MTVHQSKGLEWDAVAVVGMTDGGFPTNKGSDLRVVVDEEHLNGFQDGVWTPPEYHETADLLAHQPHRRTRAYACRCRHSAAIPP